MSAPLVSVVVLSHNRPALLERALVSVFAQAYPNMDVLVVDNRSAASHQIAEVVSRFPGTRLVALPRNAGFTGGMNIGIREARGEYLYLTEDDIEVDEGALETLAGHLDRHGEAGIAGPVMFNRTSGTVRCAGGYVSLGSTYQLTIIGENDVAAAPHGTAPYPVGYLPGASMMVRRTVFESIGGFRDEFFMYGEDVEFCERVSRAGFAIAVVPRARVRHDDDASSSPATIEFHKIKNFVSIYLIHARLSVLPFFIARYGAGGFVRALREGRGLLHLHAWTWALAHAPRFLLERCHSSQVPSALVALWR
jgi:GT2 family glycosyltransferase